MPPHSELHKLLETEFTAQWIDSPDCFPKSKRQFSYLEKRIWEIKFNRFLSVIKNEIELDSPDKNKLLDLSKSFFENSLAYSNEQLGLIFSEKMLLATRDFINKAWIFDRELSDEAIFQALRNAWVMLGLQSFFGKELKVTPSVLAYSLLYPYTDNLIDSPVISFDDKLAFSNRFANRLAGKNVIAESELESKVFTLVKMIEEEFERDSYPELYGSLLAIHNAQTQSLKLLNKELYLSEEECFQICIDKGATSVIADGFLVLGKLNDKQYSFLYEYGAYLQILDDLQDAQDDYKEGIMTYFSRHIQYGNLDQLLCKTYYFGKSFYQKLANWYPNQIAFHDLIQRSFGFLLIASVFQNQSYFSADFVRLIEKHAPFRFSFIKKKKLELKPLKYLFKEKLDAYKEMEFEL